MNIDYSQFYRGTTNIPSYGSGAYKKDTLVKYEFNTTDEHGNKIMDKMSREETLQAMKDIRSQYGDGVIVEFSGDGLAALAGGGKFMSGRVMTEEEAAKRAARDAVFQAENVIQHENTHRIVIPNYETNEHLYNSLAGAGDNVISSTMGIISNYLMPGDASGLSEQERQDMAAFGLEAAMYLAENYLDESHAADFMSAMETVAKYGLNGSVSDGGKVIYNVQEGQVRMSGAPGSYVDMEGWLKANDTELYNQINELNQSIINHKDGENHSAKFIELYTKAAKKILDASSDTKKDSGYADWKEKVEKTKLPATFQNVKYNGFQSFLESLQNQSSLSNSWISANISRFMKWLAA
ncbi:hypothetical protein [uncultured Acetatifactor sp.]|uniref:hypothetical protein n=1 Tax=uncultured Acetatifactor sp. TaxID=1671927 RepID=UPI0026058F2B|nr:hypothetical protein [uncultured Acetatifactor sp.]